MFKEKIESKESNIKFPIIREVGDFILTMLKQPVASRPGKYVMVVENSQKPDVKMEAYIDEGGDIAEVRKYTKTDDGQESFITDKEELKSFMKNFPELPFEQ